MLYDRYTKKLQSFGINNPLENMNNEVKNKMEKEKILPVMAYNVGGISLSLWDNKDKEGKMFSNVKIEKKFKAENGDWVSTNSYSVSDLPKICVCLYKIYEFSILRKHDKPQQNE
jgi:hypothetical protein